MTTAYQDLVLFDKPALYLPMDEASGDFIDLSGNGYDCSPFGALTRNSTFATVGGAGGAVSTGGYAIAQKGHLPFGNSWTVEAWVQTTAPASWFGAAQGLSWIFNFPGDLVRYDGTRNCMAKLLYYWYPPIPTTYLAAGSGDFVTASYSNATNRDDSQSYAWSDTSGPSGNPLTIPKTHIIIRRAPGIGRIRTDNLTSTIKNTVVTNDDFNQNLQRSNNKFGVGLFGAPNSLSTIYASVAQTTWLSNVAMYPYALSDAQVASHYNMGLGTPTGNRVAGTALLDGAGTAGFPVFVHRRDTGACIGRTISGVSGAFSCNVGSYAGQVYAVCFDAMSGRNLPAQVFDLITPST